MPVTDLHPQYEDREYEWRQLRDCDCGMTSIKRSGTLYLPMPDSMASVQGQNVTQGISIDSGNTNTSSKSLESRTPWSHSNPAYSSYLQRSRFPDITSSCKKGLVGVCTKKDPEIKLPSSIAYLEENATQSGLSLIDLYEKIVNEILVTGRYELLVDPTEDNKFKIITYDAENLINWKVMHSKGEESFSLAVIKEKIKDSEDEFSHDVKDGHLVLKIALDEKEDSVYVKQLYIEGVKNEGLVLPTHMGATFHSVPLVVINSEWLGSNVGSSPLLGISDIALSIYQKDADLSQSEYLTCNPMLAGFGVDDDEAPVTVGSYVSYFFANVDSDLKYVEVSGNSLQHMRERIKDLFEEASFYGASLIGPGKKAAEAVDTVKMRQSTQGATLKSVCNMAAEGIKKALEIILEWSGSSAEGLKFEPNLSFNEMNLTPEAQKALLASWMNRAISNDTFFWNMKESGLQPPGRTFEEERDLIDNQGPEIDDDEISI